MAKGLLVVMVGDENKKQTNYLGLDKTYEVEMVLGIVTDSYDLLGIPQITRSVNQNVTQSDIYPILAKMTGKINQPYPPYSAVRVQGKPLYWWARQDRLEEVTIPTAERNIYEISLQAMEKIDLLDLKTDITQRIKMVGGDFRQLQIAASWDKQLISSKIRSFQMIKLSIHCSSGTFVRGLVHQIGQELGYGAVTHSIIRTKVGLWELKDAETL